MTHGTYSLLLELFAIFVWAKVFGELFEQMRLPAVLGEILAGVILGPYATGLITPSETVGSIAQLGAIFLLFTVGLETESRALLRVGRESLEVAIAGIALPFLLGFGYLTALGHKPHEATFVAAAMVATSVGITARLLGDMEALHTRLAHIILGAAVFDDVLGMVLLAVVAGLASSAGVQLIALVVLVFEAVGFAVFMLLFAPRIVRQIQPGVERLSTRNAPLVISLAICLGLSAAAERIGLAAIVGAFFAGLAFADYSRQWNLQPRAHAINEFLAPFFFFTMGARLNLHLFNGSMLVAAVIVTILAIGSKLIGCALPLFHRDGWPAALRVGIGMVPRGEVALIVALVGLQMNMISPAAYAIVIFMTAATTLIAPPIMRATFPTAKPPKAEPDDLADASSV